MHACGTAGARFCSSTPIARVVFCPSVQSRYSTVLCSRSSSRRCCRPIYAICSSLSMHRLDSRVQALLSPVRYLPRDDFLLLLDDSQQSSHSRVRGFRSPSSISRGDLHYTPRILRVANSSDDSDEIDASLVLRRDAGLCRPRPGDHDAAISPSPAPAPPLRIDHGGCLRGAVRHPCDGRLACVSAETGTQQIRRRLKTRPASIPKLRFLAVSLSVSRRNVPSRSQRRNFDFNFDLPRGLLYLRKRDQPVPTIANIVILAMVGTG